jgi:hypothetical protein
MRELMIAVWDGVGDRNVAKSYTCKAAPVIDRGSVTADVLGKKSDGREESYR